MHPPLDVPSAPSRSSTASSAMPRSRIASSNAVVSVPGSPGRFARLRQRLTVSLLDILSRDSATWLWQQVSRPVASNRPTRELLDARQVDLKEMRNICFEAGPVIRPRASEARHRKKSDHEMLPAILLISPVSMVLLDRPVRSTRG
jgi:hypothetical protein